MLINLRNALMAERRLPYDAEVEYLECAGTSSAFPYINTGIVGDSTTTYEAMIWRGTQTTNECAIGSWNSGDTKCWIAYYFSNNFYLGMGAQVNLAGTPQPNVWYKQTLKIESSNFRLYVDDVLTVSVPQTAFTSNQPIYIGAMNSSGTAFFYFRGRFGAVKIYQNGVLVRDYIPVRKGTVGYLYDRASGKLFGNEGTGDFVVGPDVVPVEYIESHGTEWIATGVSAANTSSSLRTVASLRFTNLSYGEHDIMGSGNVVTPTMGRNGSNYFMWALAGTSWYPTACDTNWHTVSYTFNNPSGRVFELDGALYSGTQGNDFYAGDGVYVFASGPNRYPSECQLAKLEIRQNGNLIRNYISVRVGTEGALMDTLTRRIYRNAGTGAFGYGNDLPYPIPAE